MVLLSSITRTLSPVSFGLPLLIMLSMNLPLNLFPRGERASYA
jgi:hypothetical protein